MDKSYTVALLGWPELPAAARIAAEVRFATELERVLDGHDGVMKAWAESESLVEEVTGPDDMQPLETVYARALVGARVAGWVGLTDRPAGAGFQVLAADDDPEWIEAAFHTTR